MSDAYLRLSSTQRLMALSLTRCERDTGRASITAIAIAAIVAAWLCTGCASTPGSIRSAAGRQLEWCLKTPHPSPIERRQCERDAAEYCSANGLERTCGVDDLWVRQ